MDIICKDCEHNAKEHDDNYGCMFVNGKTVHPGDGCICSLSESDVLYIHITEQQARLDTCRAQVEALISERDTLKAQKLELIKAVELFLDCKYDADEKARKILGEVCDA